MNFLEKIFKISEHNSSVRVELLAGLTTFLAMSYIIFVNPSILSEAGLDWGAVFVATCIASAFGCILMGVVANYPIALAPGMGLNAYFTYTVCLGMGVPWQVALAAVCVSGIVFVIFSVLKIREAIINGIPRSLKFAIGAGIGLFLTLIGMKGAGIVVDNPATLVGLGDIKSKAVQLSLLGFFIIVALDHFRIRGAIIISILITTVLAIVYQVGDAEFKGIVGDIPSIAPTLMQMDFKNLFTPALLSVIFVFFLVDLFDSTGTMIGVAHRAGLLNEKGELPRLNRALLADSSAIVAGSALGTSSVTAYVESAAGVAAGGKTGLTSIVVGVLFLAALWFSPLVGSVPAFATAPALIFVGILMMKGCLEIDWNDLTEAAPAFFTIAFMPFTYSIANGIAMGFISYAIIKALCGKAREVPIMVWIVSALWVAKFWYFGG
ncbi:MAG: NCS2 family permease [Neisseriaceae bacterium]|nr:NCS2 family permease [Neisseriaceae bacterium]